MPVQRGKSSVLAKLGPRLDKAVAAHAQDETDLGFRPLPPGITNGIAKLTKCYFAEYKSGPNAGKPYFRAEGVVVEPETWPVNGIEDRVQGRTTSIMEPVCDTKTQAGKETSLDLHIKEIENHMRLLAGDEFTHGATSGDDLERMAADLQQAAPYFRFSTSPKKDQKTGEVTGSWENWHGSKGLEDYEPPEEPIDDASAPSRRPSANGAVAGRGGPPSRAVAQAEEGEGETQAEEFSEFDDLDSLVERATADDKDAAKRLAAMAAEAGISEKKVEGAESWQAVADMITKARGEEAPEDEEEPETEDEEQEEEAEEEAAAEPEPVVVKKGDVYRYKPLTVDPKTKKKVRVRKAVECEAVAVNRKDKTADLKDLATRKVYKGAPWDQCEPV